MNIAEYIRMTKDSSVPSAIIRQFKMVTYLVSHIRAHTHERPYKCPELYCNYSAKTRTGLQKHSLVHSGEKKYSCPVCAYRAWKKSTVKAHMLTHGEEKPFACSLCPYKALHRRQSNIRQHITHVHSMERPFKCSHCEYAAKAKSKLTTHLRIHSGSRPNECRKL